MPPSIESVNEESTGDAFLCCVESGKVNLRLALVHRVFINNHFAMCFVYATSMTRISSDLAVRMYCTTVA